MSNEFIIYACPTGILAEQLKLYFEQSLTNCGPNTAHRFMPHCTLTGFFREQGSAIPLYLRALERAINRALPICPQPPIVVRGLVFRPDWHGLELESPWLKQLMVNIASTATSPTRQTPLRLKDWLHLSLAYEFRADEEESLRVLAQDLIDPAAPVDWELRFYQRHPHNNSWICHHVWPLKQKRKPKSSGQEAHTLTMDLPESVGDNLELKESVSSDLIVID